MERNEKLKIVKEQLTEERYVHTIGVMETAIQLAQRFGANVEKAETAAIFHDYAKYCPKEEMKQIIIEQNMPKELLHYHSELWHAPVGAFLVHQEVGVDDEEILNAIRYHTSGRAGMTLLEKVIYLADYIEPNRSFPGVEEVRKLAENNLDQALMKAIQNTIVYLVGKSFSVYPDTFHTYNDLVMSRRTDE